MADCFTCDSTRVMHVCVLSAFTFATLLSVLFRFCARRIQRIRLELNDYLCILGLVGSRPLECWPNADRTLGLHHGVDSLHNSFHSPQLSQPRSRLGRQSAAGGTAPLDHVRYFHPGLCLGSLYSDFPDAVLSRDLLRRSRLQSGLFRGRSPSLLLDMPSFRIPLGSVHPRLLWRSEVSRSFHRSFQPLDGHHDCCTPNARSVGSSSADEEEADHSSHVFHGSSVSAPQEKKKRRETWTLISRTESAPSRWHGSK